MLQPLLESVEPLIRAHVHALASEGITIDGMGPFPDADPFGCGCGVIDM
jgi:hypothetical protein